MPEGTDAGTVPIRDAFTFGWEAFKSDWRFWVVVAAVYPLLALGLNIVEALIAAIFGGLLVLAAPLTLLALCAYVYIQTRISIGTVSALLKAADGGRPQLADLWGSLDPFWSFLIAYAAFSIVVGIGFWLLVFPGLYLVARFGLYGFAIVDRRCGVIESFHISSRLTEGRRGPLLLFWLIVIVLNIVAAVPLGLGLIVSVPVSLTAAARIYRHLEGAPEALHVAFAGRPQ